MATTRTLRINGKTVTATVDDPATPFLYVLRNDAGLRGPRFGCGLGQMRLVHRACERRAGALLHAAFVLRHGTR
jgi:aerobic-type carbon monoxide dehydrogenase small subunit (CoxS/CutS family)